MLFRSPPLWRLPASTGKYHNRYYSRKVWETSVSKNKLPSKSSGTWTEKRSEVILEHVVERAQMIAWILEDLSRINDLENVCLCCVVTKDESKSLPSNYVVDPKNIWKRYIDGKVDVYDRLANKWHILDGVVQS